MESLSEISGCGNTAGPAVSGLVKQAAFLNLQSCPWPDPSAQPKLASMRGTTKQNSPTKLDLIEP
jgi:hypothetical protein